MADKAITDLTQATQITGDDLFVLEQSGEAKKLKGSQVVQYAKDAVAAEVQGVKEYADNAKTSADAAAASATKAATAAQGIDDKVAAADASAKAAASSAAAAAASATGIDEKVQAAQTAATNAAKSETAAKDAETAAGNAQKVAETAQTGAQAAKTAAESAQGAAESAKDAAADSSTSAGQKATQAARSAEDAASAKSAAETAKTDAQAARDAIVNMMVEAITLETGKPATVSKSLVDNVYKLVFGLPRGETGATGPQGATGNGISGIALKSGNHAPGTSDVYTITLTDGTIFDFAVYNGANGQGAGDMLASVYDPQGKRTDVYKYVDDGLAKKQGVNDGIQGLRLRGGINSGGSLQESVAINPAVNGAGFARLRGAIVKIYYGSYEMPIDNYSIDCLFDGKFDTYINFPQPSGSFAWENLKTYPVGAYVTNGGYWYKALKENTNVTPADDTTGTWELASRSQAGSYINLDNVPISIDITFPFSIRYENSLALYWRSNWQNASYLKVEKYDSNLEWFQVYETSSIDGGDIVNNIWLSQDPSGGGTQKRLRITFQSRSNVNWCALTQIAITGVVGGIEGTLVNRDGSTMYGNLSPYTAGGASLGTSSAPWKDVRAQNVYGNVNNTTSTFSQASSRVNIASGEKLSVLFGKIAKWFADLGGLAFKSSVSKSDLAQDVQTSLDKADSALQSAPVTSVDGKTGAVTTPMHRVTLAVASWNSSTMQQTVTCAGILSDKTKQMVICAAVDESYDSAWNTCYVQCVGRAADSLTFQCDEIPTVAVEVFVTIKPVEFVS